MTRTRKQGHYEQAQDNERREKALKTNTKVARNHTKHYFELNTNEVLTHAHVAFGDTIQVILI